MHSRHICLLGFLVFLVSCSSSSRTVKMFSQPQVNALVASDRFQEAAQIVKTQYPAYGPTNKLLYFLDKAYVLQMAGLYQESITVFEKAKQQLDELYTHSISNIATTWLVNDNRAPYRGEYFEHTLVNVLQSFNFAALGDVPEALVEMRDADRKLNVLQDVYRYNKAPVYREDAMARLWTGILYESRGDRQNINDAVIAYRNALKIYQDGFHSRTGIQIPPILIENILAATQYMGFSDYATLRTQFPNIKYLSIVEKSKKAEIYLIHQNGLSPVKHPQNIPVPLPGGYVSQLAFPTYDERFYSISSAELQAINEQQAVVKANSELCANIETIAAESLKDRKVQIYAKSALRPLGKYVAERAVETKVEEKNGEGAATAVKAVGSIYNLFSEQADLRSWQTLPAQIRIARLILDPGVYHLSVRLLGYDGGPIAEKPLGPVKLSPGDKRFFVLRTVE